VDYTEVAVLNVGAGSCTAVWHAGSARITMVDTNDGGDQRSYEDVPSQRPLTDPISWVRENFGGGGAVFRFILSHPDADHMAGIRRILTGELSVSNFWDIPHTRHRKEGDCRSEAAWHDWLFYDAMRRGLAVDGVSWPKVISPMRGSALDFWRHDGIEVLSPTPELVAAADQVDTYNNASYVLRFSHAGRSVLLASDIEEPAWEDMIDAGIELRANVLIASHHGRKSGFSAEAMDLIRPEVVIVSTAKLKPEHDGISQYKRYCEHVLSTRVDGDIRVRMLDDGALQILDQDRVVLASFVEA